MWKVLTPVLVALALLPPASALAVGPVHRCVVEGTLGWHGNVFSRLPDGKVIISTMTCEWEGYFVEAGGQKYILDLPVGHAGAERLKGKRVKVTGELGSRQVGFPDRRYQMPFLRITTLVTSDAVEVKGKLAVDPTEILRPFGGTRYITAEGQRYYLDFGKTTDLEKVAASLKGTAVATGRLEVSGRWLLLHVATLKAAEALQERTYEGDWQTKDTLYALKSGDHRPLIDHIRDILGEDLKVGGHTMGLEGKMLVVRTTAANHARIERFRKMLATIPGPAR
jgi:hypothetical protein